MTSARSKGNPDSDTADDGKVRLDKWLWAARFFKTRTLAKEAIEGGKVHYNGARTKPGKIVEIGARLKIRQGWDEREVEVLGLSEQRRAAPEAQKLYAELEESLRKREQAAWERRQFLTASMPPPRRPTKKQRRDIQRFREQAGTGD